MCTPVSKGSKTEMRRDMELVRTILLEVEKAPFDGGWVELKVEGRDRNEVAYHVMLLHQAGLIEAMDLSTMGAVNWAPRWLTWAGHEFLEAARDENLWETAKTTVRERAGGVPFEVLKGVLVGLIKTAVMGP